MASEFYNKFDIVKKFLNQRMKDLGFLYQNNFRGPEEKLTLTENTQPAILTASYSIFKVLKEEFNFDLQTFKFFAGHSLGEYSALVSSNSLNFSDAVYLLSERGKAMQKSVPVGEGKMIAILGLDIDELEEIIKKKNDNGICEVANDNSIGQVILSGNKQAVEEIQQTMKEKIKTIPLNVSAPFHCALMKPASEEMSKKINKTDFKKPSINVISNVTAKPVIETETIKTLLVEQIFSTVKWRESIIFMSKSNVSNFIEIGPGKVLTGMVKRTIKGANCFSINSIADIKNLQMNLKNKKILITGATGGIGNSLVDKFYKSESSIIATGTNEEKIKKLKENYPNIITEKFKLDEHEKIEEFIEKIEKKLNGLDVLINNAGITLDNLSIRLTEENWKKVLDINLTSTFDVQIFN